MSSPTKTPRYDKAYFIAKLSAIPENQWCCGVFINLDYQRCALGHCMEMDIEDTVQVSREAHLLTRLFGGGLKGFDKVGSINDGTDDRYQQATPKRRILAALNDLP